MLKQYRSYLFVPAKDPSIIKKAVDSEADAVIIDLEDAVAYSEKNNARRVVEEALKQFAEAGPILVRTNDFSTPFWEEDLDCAIRNGADGVIVPKSEGGEQVRTICEKAREIIQQQPNGRASPFEVIPLVETARGVQFVYEIAEADSLISRIAFGSIDYSLDIGCELTPEREELLYTLSRIVVASRAAGIGSPIDAVYPDLKNEGGLEQEVLHGKKLGFKGKLVIHPRQVDIVNRIFSPGETEVAEARQVVEQFEKAEAEGKASISVNGKLVDYPVYKKAKELLTFEEVERT